MCTNGPNMPVLVGMFGVSFLFPGHYNVTTTLRVTTVITMTVGYLRCTKEAGIRMTLLGNLHVVYRILHVTVESDKCVRVGNNHDGSDIPMRLARDNLIVRGSET